eukprot:3704151-Amphidinium_carterae.1
MCQRQRASQRMPPEHDLRACGCDLARAPIEVFKDRGALSSSAIVMLILVATAADHNDDDDDDDGDDDGFRCKFGQGLVHCLNKGTGRLDA